MAINTTVIGWKIRYADGSVVTSKTTSWALAKGNDVQVVTLYHASTHPIFVMDHYDEQGRPVNPRWETWNYVTLLHSQDVYWKHPGRGEFGAGRVVDIPPAVEVKTGLEILEEDFRAILKAASDDRVWTE